MLRKREPIFIVVLLLTIVNNSYSIHDAVPMRNNFISPRRCTRSYLIDGCDVDPDVADLCDHVHREELCEELEQVKMQPGASYKLSHSPFSPVCLRCSICISIVEKLNETLNLAHSVLYYKKRLDDVSETLRSLCVNGFEQLRSTCHDYLDSYGELHFYESWLEDSDSLVDKLCRGSGMLRDCANVRDAHVSVNRHLLLWPWSTLTNLLLEFRTACP